MTSSCSLSSSLSSTLFSLSTHTLFYLYAHFSCRPPRQPPQPQQSHHSQQQQQQQQQQAAAASAAAALQMPINYQQFANQLSQMPLGSQPLLHGGGLEHMHVPTSYTHTQFL